MMVKCFEILVVGFFGFFWGGGGGGGRGVQMKLGRRTLLVLIVISET